MPEDDDDAPLDPKKVILFVMLLAMVAFAGWRFMRARAAVAAVAEASKDYRKLFPARSAEVPVEAPKPVVTAEAPRSGIGMLMVDADMRAPAPAPAAAAPPPQAPPAAEPPPAVQVQAAAPKAAPKTFNRKGLNSGAFSGLNGGSGVGFSGSAMSGGGGGSAPAPAAPAMPDISKLLAAPPAADKK